MEGGGGELQKPYGVLEPSSWLRPAGGEESIAKLSQNQTDWLVSHAPSDHSLSLTRWSTEQLEDGKHFKAAVSELELKQEVIFSKKCSVDRIINRRCGTESHISTRTSYKL